ncbi:MAG: TonB-dependent receptor, partial [Parahaliea sp.]
YGGRARMFMAPFMDIERIEVLRGPQGAVVGKNTSAGAISIITKKPGSEHEFQLSADYETEYESTTFQAIASGPLSDNFLARLTVKTEDIGGYVHNTMLNRDEPDKENLVIRATGVWLASDKTTVTGKAEFANFDAEGFPYSRIAMGSEADSAKYERQTDGVVINDSDETQTLTTSVTVTTTLGDHDLTSITAYSEVDADYQLDGDFGPLPFLGFPFSEDYTQYSQEFRFNSPLGEKFDYIVGALYVRHDLDVFRQTNFFALFGTIHNSWYTQKSDTTSLYGQGTWHITPDFDATLSLRYTYESKDAQLRRAQILDPEQPISLGLTDPFDEKRSENLLDPTLTLNYQLSDTTMVFLRFAQGSKGGGFVGASREATVDTFELEEETATSYEAGTRIKTADGSVFIGLTAFYTEYEDLQVSSFNGITTDYGNAGEAETQGAELEVSWQLSSSLRFDGSMAYLDAKYTSYPGAPCVRPRHAIPGCIEDIAGAPLHNAPEWSASASLNYSVQITGGLLFDGTLGVTYEDDSYTHSTLMPESLQKSFAKVDLRLALAADNDRWEIAFVGKNLTDEQTISQGFETPFSAPAGAIPDYDSATVYLDVPRTYTIQGKLRF